VLELQRLVLHPSERGFPLTSLISKTVKIIRVHRDDDLLVSFADAGEGHHGGVYQAASWIYAGQRDPAMDGLTVNGTFVAGRSCNAAWGTRSPVLLRDKYPGWEIEPHYDVGKHLYWKPLKKSGKHKARRLGLDEQPYPKVMAEV